MSGLDYETRQWLREKFPRVAIAEMVDYIVGLPSYVDMREVFASAHRLGKEIGRSSRTVFRYMRRLKDEKLLDRTPGRRDGPPPQKYAKHPQALKQHGFARTTLHGWLGEVAAQGMARRAEYYRRRHQRSERSWREKQAEKRRTHAAYHQIWQREFPDLAAQQTDAERPERPPVPQQRRPEVTDAEREVWARLVPKGQGPPD